MTHPVIPAGWYAIPDPAAPDGHTVWHATTGHLRPTVRTIGAGAGDDYREYLHAAVYAITADPAAGRARFAALYARCAYCGTRKLGSARAHRRGTCAPCARTLSSAEQRDLADAIQRVAAEHTAEPPRPTTGDTPVNPSAAALYLQERHMITEKTAQNTAGGGSPPFVILQALIDENAARVFRCAPGGTIAARNDLPGVCETRDGSLVRPAQSGCNRASLVQGSSAPDAVSVGTRCAHTAHIPPLTSGNGAPSGYRIRQVGASG